MEKAAGKQTKQCSSDAICIERASGRFNDNDRGRVGKVRTSPPSKSARGIDRASIELEVPRLLPIGDVVDVAHPLLALELEPCGLHLRAEGGAAQRVGFERVERFFERLWKMLDV